MAQSNGGAVSLSEPSDSSLLPSHGTSNPDATSGFYLSSDSEQGFIHYDASMNDVAEFLVGSSAYDLGMSHASQMFGIKQSADIAFKNGVAEGIHNVRAATANRIANTKGFNANYMTANQWQGIVNNKTRQWSSELQSDVMDIVSAPLVLTGFGYAGMRLIGSGALKLAQGSFRGSMISGSHGLAASKSITGGLTRVGLGAQMITTGTGFASNSLTGSNDNIKNTYQFYQNIPKGDFVDRRFTFSAEYNKVEAKLTAFGTDIPFAIGAKYKGFESPAIGGGTENSSIRFGFNNRWDPSLDVIHEYDAAKKVSLFNKRFEVKSGTRAVANQLDFTPRGAVNAKLKLGSLYGIDFALGYDVRF